MRKIILILLSALIIMNMFVISAFGIEYNDIDVTTDQEMYDVLSAYNIFRGYDTGDFKPDKDLSRAELVKVLSTLTGFMKYSEFVETSFSDVKGTWAENYIAIAESIGISKGYSDGTFRPNDLVVYEDAVTMLLRTMGYADENMKGNYPDNYMAKANEIGLFEGIHHSDINIDRADMAKLVYNALSKDLVEFIDGDFQSKGKTLFDNLGSSDRIDITPEFIFNHREYDFADFVGNTCDVYFDTDNKVILVRNPKYSIEKGVVNSVLDTNTMFIKEDYGSIVMKKIDINNVIYNYTPYFVSFSDYDEAEITMLKKDNVVEKVVLDMAKDEKILTYQDLQNGLLYMIKSTLDEEYIENVFDKTSQSLSEEDLEDCFIRIYGDATSFEDIREHDYIKFYPSKSNDYKYLGIKVIRKNIEGTFNGYRVLDYVDYISIDYTLYKIKNKPNEILVEGDKLFAIFNEDKQIIDVYVTNYVTEPENLARVVEVKSVENSLPMISIVDDRGRNSSYQLNEYSGVVFYKLKLDGSREYYTTLKPNDFIYFSVYDENSIKKVQPVESIAISGKLAGDKKKIGVYQLNDATCLIDNESNEKLTTDLYDIVAGNAVVDKDNKILMYAITENTKVPEVVVAEKIQEATPVEDKDTSEENSGSEAELKDNDDNITDNVNKSVKQIEGVINYEKSSTDKLYLYNMDGYFKLEKTLKLDSFKNKFVLVSADDGVVINVKAYEADGSKCKVTKIYENQAQLFGFSYIEFNSNVDVFLCGLDDKDNFISFIKGGIDDISAGDVINYYDTHGSYDGVIDVIIIFK